MSKIMKCLSIKNRIILLMSILSIFLAVLIFLVLSCFLTENIIQDYNSRVKSGTGVLASMVEPEWTDLYNSKEFNILSDSQKIIMLSRNLDKYLNVVWSNNDDITFGFYSNQFGILKFTTDNTGKYYTGLRLNSNYFSNNINTMRMKLWFANKDVEISVINPIVVDGKNVGYSWGAVKSSKIFEKGKHALLLLLALIVIGVILVIFVANMVYTKVHRDIKELKNGIEFVSYDINYRLPPMAGELNALSSGINEMTSLLSEFYNFTTKISGSKNIDDIYEKILSGTIKLLNVKKILLYTVDECMNINMVKYIGFKDENIREFARNTESVLNGLTEKVAVERTPVIVDNIYEVGQNSMPYHIALNEGISSGIYVPLIIHNDVRGVIVAFSHEKNKFNNHHIKLLATLANHGAYAIEDALLLKKLEEEALSDPLTGLFNRRYMDIFIKEEICKGERFGQSVSCMVIDIDDFKKINDTYGHYAGDVVIKKLAHIIKSSIRGYDTAVRFGGEEFLVIMPQTYIQVGILIAERIRKRVENTQFIVEYHKIKVTVSIGVSEWNDANKDYDFVDNADKALYKAKNSGRNRVEKAG